MMSIYYPSYCDFDVKIMLLLQSSQSIIIVSLSRVNSEVNSFMSKFPQYVKYPDRIIAWDKITEEGINEYMNDYSRYIISMYIET